MRGCELWRSLPSWFRLTLGLVLLGDVIAIVRDPLRQPLATDPDYARRVTEDRERRGRFGVGMYVCLSGVAVVATSGRSKARYPAGRGGALRGGSVAQCDALS